MAKIYGLFGSMTGKLADTVMAVRNGEQLARKYQPIVANPNTPAQVASRAKLKLMSQLSAVMAPVIAMPRVGSISSRNVFLKKNYALASYSNDQAEVELANIQLTSSVVALPGLDYVVRGEGTVTLGIGSGSKITIDRVVYALFEKTADNKLRYVGSAVANAAGDNFRWTVTLDAPDSTLVAYAYGIRDNNEAARAKYGDLSVLTAETIAKLIVSRSLLESDITLTETRSSLIAAVTPGD